MVHSLNNKQYTAKDIESILDIDRNKLFYWIKTYRMLRPEIEEASGTGKASKYSFKNLLELATIRELIRSGFDMKTTKDIKQRIDNYKDKKKLNIFEKFIVNFINNEEDSLEFDVNIYADKEAYKIEITKFKMEMDPFDGYVPVESEVYGDEIKSKPKMSEYIRMVFSLSDLFKDIIKKTKNY